MDLISSKRKTRCGEEGLIWFSEKFSATDVISIEGEVLIWFFIGLIWFIGNFSANEDEDWMQTHCSYLSETYLWQFKWKIFWIRTSHKKYGKMVNRKDSPVKWFKTFGETYNSKQRFNIHIFQKKWDVRERLTMEWERPIYVENSSINM